jgi:hypothetical protein
MCGCGEHDHYGHGPGAHMHGEFGPEGHRHDMMARRMFKHGGPVPGAFGFRRRFVSREERAARLEAYLNDLQAEAKAVEERIEELRNGAPSDDE